MKFKCLKCETEFEAKMVARCPNCGETMDLEPIYTYKYARARKQPA